MIPIRFEEKNRNEKSDYILYFALISIFFYNTIKEIAYKIIIQNKKAVIVMQIVTISVREHFIIFCNRLKRKKSETTVLITQI